MKVFITSTMALGVLCVLVIGQPAKAEISTNDPNFQLVRHSGHHGGGGGHHRHHHGRGGWGYGVGGLGVGLGLGVLGSTIYNNRNNNYGNCFYDQYGTLYCYTY